MSTEYSTSDESFQLIIMDGALNDPQVQVCLGAAYPAPWGNSVVGLPGWTAASADAFVQAVVTAYHAHAPAGSTPSVSYQSIDRTLDQVQYTVDPVTGAVS